MVIDKCVYENIKTMSRRGGCVCVTPSFLRGRLQEDSRKSGWLSPMWFKHGDSINNHLRQNDRQKSTIIVAEVHHYCGRSWVIWKVKTWMDRNPPMLYEDIMMIIMKILPVFRTRYVWLFLHFSMEENVERSRAGCKAELVVKRPWPPACVVCTAEVCTCVCLFSPANRTNQHLDRMLVGHLTPDSGGWLVRTSIRTSINCSCGE